MKLFVAEFWNVSVLNTSLYEPLDRSWHWKRFDLSPSLLLLSHFRQALSCLVVSREIQRISEKFGRRSCAQWSPDWPIAELIEGASPSQWWSVAEISRFDTSSSGFVFQIHRFWALECQWKHTQIHKWWRLCWNWSQEILLKICTFIGILPRWLVACVLVLSCRGEKSAVRNKPKRGLQGAPSPCSKGIAQFAFAS